MALALASFVMSLALAVKSLVLALALTVKSLASDYVSTPTLLVTKRSTPIFHCLHAVRGQLAMTVLPFNTLALHSRLNTAA